MLLNIHTVWHTHTHTHTSLSLIECQECHTCLHTLGPARGQTAWQFQQKWLRYLRANTIMMAQGFWTPYTTRSTFSSLNPQDIHYLGEVIHRVKLNKPQRHHTRRREKTKDSFLHFTFGSGSSSSSHPNESQHRKWNNTVSPLNKELWHAFTMSSWHYWIHCNQQNYDKNLRQTYKSSLVPGLIGQCEHRDVCL